MDPWNPSDDGRLSPMLRAFEQWLRSQDESLEVRGPADGWRAVYVGRLLALMVRCRDPRAAPELDIVSRRTGLEFRLRSTTQLADPLVANPIREALVATRDGLAPVHGMDDVATAGRAGGPSAVAFWVVEDTIRFLVAAPGWLRGTSLVAIALVAITILVGAVTTVPVAAAVPGALAGTLLAAGVLRRRFPPSALDSAEVEEGMRAHVGLIGCLGTGIVLLCGLLVSLFVAEALAHALEQSSSAFIGPFYLVGAGLAWILVLWGLRALRRRLPPPPTSRAAGLFGRALLAVAIVGSLAFGALLVVGAATVTVTAEEAAWCLGPGRPYLDRAVEVLGMPRTWNDSSAPGDRNFASACSTAWDATHP